MAQLLRRLREHEGFKREEVGERPLNRLQAFDEHHARSAGETIFNWGYRREVKARNYVGVVQVPGLTVEVLPKVDDLTSEETAQRNLIYMLGVTRMLPGRQRATSALRTQHHRLLDAFVSAFAEALLSELRRGLHHQYVVTEENRGYYRGKLLIPQHMRLNAFHKERCYSACDEFLADTPLNRLLKATCRFLLRSVRFPWPQRCLKEAVLQLDEISDEPLSPELLGRVHLDRSSERFEDLVAFCRLVVEGLSPTPQGGEHESFSLLFPMERLFELFVGELIRRNAESLGLFGCQIHLQARGRSQCLVRRDGVGAFRLKPDVLVVHDGQVVLIVDTKWKQLSAEEGARGVSSGDMYQLHAYLMRYRCDEAVLLFPRWAGGSRGTFVVDGDPAKRIRVEMLDVSGELTTETALKALGAVLGKASAE